MDLSRSVATCGLDAVRRDAIQSFLAFVSKASTKLCIKSFLLCPTIDSASLVPVVELLQGVLTPHSTFVAFPVSRANQRCITSALISVFKFASIASSSLRSNRSTTPSSFKCLPSIRWKSFLSIAGPSSPSMVRDLVSRLRFVDARFLSIRSFTSSKPTAAASELRSTCRWLGASFPSLALHLDTKLRRLLASNARL